ILHIPKTDHTQLVGRGKQRAVGREGERLNSRRMVSYEVVRAGEAFAFESQQVHPVESSGRSEVIVFRRGRQGKNFVTREISVIHQRPVNGLPKGQASFIVACREKLAVAREIEREVSEGAGVLGFSNQSAALRIPYANCLVAAATGQPATV